MVGETFADLNIGIPVGPQVCRLLRDRIVRGELVPGTRLSEVDIAMACGTSRQPVREAFIRLAEAALIEIRPQRGSYVRPISPDPADCDALDAILAGQEELVDLEDPRPFMASDEAFHRRLAQNAGQGPGWDFMQPLKTQMDRVRHLSAVQFPRRILLDQHRRIVQIIRDGDADGAERHMRHHLRRILEDLPVVAAAFPGFFEPMPDTSTRGVVTLLGA